VAKDSFSPEATLEAPSLNERKLQQAADATKRELVGEKGGEEGRGSEPLKGPTYTWAQKRRRMLFSLANRALFVQKYDFADDDDDDDRVEEEGEGGRGEEGACEILYPPSGRYARAGKAFPSVLCGALAFPGERHPERGESRRRRRRRRPTSISPLPRAP